MLFGRKNKIPIKIADKNVREWKYTTCGYCSTGCSMEVGLNPEGRPVATRGVAGADVNRGKLCVKGIFEHELFNSAGRGKEPLYRSRYFENLNPSSGIPRWIPWAMRSSAFKTVTAATRSL